MSQKIAVAIIHGIGLVERDFADGLMRELRKRFVSNGASGPDLVMKPVLWSPVLQGAENDLWVKLKKGGPLAYKKVRRFMVDFAADAIAYQPVSKERRVYDAVHWIFAKALRSLAEEAGPHAPLCVVAHSLGTVIASNYLYDLQTDVKKKCVSKTVRRVMKGTPLEKGKTLSLLYTLGSPLALWSLRYPNFGIPIQVPAPELRKYWPKIKGEWVNFYDKDDVIGYPLKTINASYRKSVTSDKPVNVGGFFKSKTPLSHTEYWTDNDVTKPIARSLARVWRKLNR